MSRGPFPKHTVTNVRGPFSCGNNCHKRHTSYPPKVTKRVVTRVTNVTRPYLVNALWQLSRTLQIISTKCIVTIVINISRSYLLQVLSPLSQIFSYKCNVTNVPNFTGHFTKCIVTRVTRSCLPKSIVITITNVTTS